MKLKQETKIALNTLSHAQFTAIRELCEYMQYKWSRTTFKKDTEFDTIWAVASFESKSHGLDEFLQILFNPEQIK